MNRTKNRMSNSGESTDNFPVYPHLIIKEAHPTQARRNEAEKDPTKQGVTFFIKKTEHLLFLGSGFRPIGSNSKIHHSGVFENVVKRLSHIHGVAPKVKKFFIYTLTKTESNDF